MVFGTSIAAADWMAIFYDSWVCGKASMRNVGKR
jgi:hypothetical protein